MRNFHPFYLNVEDSEGADHGKVKERQEMRGRMRDEMKDEVKDER